MVFIASTMASSRVLTASSRAFGVCGASFGREACSCSAASCDACLSALNASCCCWRELAAPPAQSARWAAFQSRSSDCRARQDCRRPTPRSICPPWSRSCASDRHSRVVKIRSGARTICTAWIMASSRVSAASSRASGVNGRPSGRKPYRLLPWSAAACDIFDRPI